jgi:uncharacterized protein YndB with AHSA1/START domain
MGHDFETSREFDLDATPEQVWEAIATGPGIDSWFMGRNDVQAGEGGTVRTAFGGYAPESTVTAWDPLKRFAHHSGEAPDGRFMAYEFLIEGRAAGSTVLRVVTSGFLPGEDWESEYEAMTAGFDLFFGTLAEYVTHFAGRTATPVTAFGPPVADWSRAWAVLGDALGLTGPPAVGDRVRFTPDGLAGVDGVVYLTNPDALALRTDDALYRFLRGFRGPMVASHHLFSGDGSSGGAERAWQAWLARTFA